MCICMIKISGKVDKLNSSNVFSCDISFFIQGRTSKNEISILNPLKAFGLSTFPLIFIVLSDLPKSTISPERKKNGKLYIHISPYLCIYNFPSFFFPFCNRIFFF